MQASRKDSMDPAIDLNAANNIAITAHVSVGAGVIPTHRGCGRFLGLSNFKHLQTSAPESSLSSTTRPWVEMLRLPTLGPSQNPPMAQIGRASRRERVCQ